MERKTFVVDADIFLELLLDQDFDHTDLQRLEPKTILAQC